MSIHARIRLLWGALGLIVSSLLLSWAYGTVAMNNQQPGPLAVSSNEPSCAATVRSNLAQIAGALEDYRWDNDGALPPKLSMLYPTYISDPAVFWSPGDSDPCPTTIDNDELNRPNSTQISFRYLRILWTADSAPQLILQDNSLANNGGTGIYGVKFEDNEVRFFERTATPPSWTATARSSLHQLGAALMVYASNNNGHYPDQLSRLYPAYISNAGVFWNPGDTSPTTAPTVIDNDTLEWASSSQMSYWYSGSTYVTSCDSATILLADNSPANNGGATVNVLTADGVVSTYIQRISCTHPLECRTVAHINLSKIANCLVAYSQSNHLALPSSLSMFYRNRYYQIYDPMTFWHPGDSDPAPLFIDNDAPNVQNSTQVSFAYFSGNNGSYPVAVVVQDQSLTNNTGAGLHVVTKDGSVEFFERCNRSLASSATARTNLQLIGQALQAYASANAGHYPTQLSLLYPSYISNPAVFWNPGDTSPCPTTIQWDTPNWGNSAQVSFNYLGAPYSAGCDPGVVLLADNTLANNAGVGINALTADYQVGYFAPARETCYFAYSCTMTARSRLHEIGNELLSYASSYNDWLPPRLSMLYPKKIPRPLVFWHPGDVDDWPLTISNDGLNQADSAQISFEFLGAGRNLGSMSPDEIILRDNTPANNNGDGILALYADGHVDYVPIRRVNSISIMGPDSVPEGGTATFTAAANYDIGTTGDVTSLSWWWTMEAPGMFATPGQYVASAPVLADTPRTIHLRYVDEEGQQFEASKTVTVQNTVRIPTGLTISSGPTTVAEGGTGSYKCTATYDDGGTEDVTAPASWSVASGPGAFSTAGTYAAPASVLADTPATIKVSYSRDGGTKDATKNITIQNTLRVLASLSISSGLATVNEGATATYTCTATYDDGTTENVTASASWSVASGPGSFPTAGTYAAPASVIADMPAMLLVTCTKGSVTKQATKNITVNNSVRILTSLSISSGPASVPEGATASYTCTATYDDSTTQNVTASATWSVASGPGSFPNPGTYAAPASVTANTPATLQATYTESGVTKQATRIIDVTKGFRKLTAIAISGPDMVNEAGTADFTCTATYDDATTRDVTIAASWYTMGNPGTFPQPGKYTSPASVLADTPSVIYVSHAEGGVSKQASKGIMIVDTEHKLTGIAITSGPLAVYETWSAEYVCTATYDDGSAANVTNQATWSVTSGAGSFTAPGMFAAADSILADTPTRLFVSLTQGEVTRKASLDIMVENVILRLVRVTVTGPDTAVATDTFEYTCTAEFDDGYTEDVTHMSTWLVASGPGSFRNDGFYEAPLRVVAPVEATIKARFTQYDVTKEASKVIVVVPEPDADGDGVGDGLDSCADTPLNDGPDEHGCGASQRDSDFDGVKDNRDECPGMSTGWEVESNGCPPSDRDLDGIPDKLEGCPDDPNKWEPGTCGCGVPETPGCGAPSTYTVRVITPEGSAWPLTCASNSWAAIAAPTAPEGMRFSHWSGAYSGTDEIASVYVDGDKEIVANYEPCPEQGPAPCGAGAPAACGVTALLTMTLLKRRMVRGK